MHAQLWPTLRTAILAEADPNPDLRLDCVPVGTLKHYATGNVSAKKLDMARALARIFHRRLQNWFFSEENS